MVDITIKAISRGPRAWQFSRVSICASFDDKAAFRYRARSRGCGYSIQALHCQTGSEEKPL